MKVIFLYCVVVSNACVLAGESNNTLLAVPSNQTNVVVRSSGYTMYPAAGPITYVTNGSTSQRKIKKLALASSPTDFLNQEIEKLICLQKDRAKIISDQIDAQYVGVGDNWSLKRYLEISLGKSALPPHFFSSEHQIENKVRDAVRDLAAIQSLIGTPLDKQLIDELRYANTRFDQLLEIVIAKSKSNVFGGGCCRFNITSSTIDTPFDSNKTFSDLPLGLQQYINSKLEQVYRNVFNLKECVKIVPHLLHQALLGCEGDKNKLEALLKSSILRQYGRENKKFGLAFKQAIRASFAKLSIDKPGQLVEFGIEKSSQDAVVAIQKEYRCADGTEQHTFSGLEIIAALVLVLVVLA